MNEIHYLLGNTCNLNCDFCFWEKKFPPTTFKLAKHIIDEIKKTGIKKITISGGEPTCTKHFIKILKYAKQNNLEAILHTNGLQINKKIAKKIAPLISRISLAIDGSNEKIAIEMRKKPFTKHTLFLIDLFNSLKVPVNVKTLITKINKKDIKNIGQILCNKNIQYWSLLEFNPLGRGLDNKNKYFLPTKEFELITKKLLESFPKMEIKIRRFKSQPEKYCFIDVQGKVYTNTKKGDILIGNLKNNSLLSILKLKFGI